MAEEGVCCVRRDGERVADNLSSANGRARDNREHHRSRSWWAHSDKDVLECSRTTVSVYPAM